MAFDLARKNLSELRESFAKTPSYSEQYRPRLSSTMKIADLQIPQAESRPVLMPGQFSEDFTGLFGMLRQAKSRPEDFAPKDWGKASVGEKAGAAFAETIHSGWETAGNLLGGAARDFGEGVADVATLAPRASLKLANNLGVVKDEWVDPIEKINEKIRREIKITTSEFVAGMIGNRVRYEGEEAPEGFGEKLAAGIANGMGAVLSISKIAKGVQSMTSGKRILEFSARFPKLYNYFSTTASFMAYGQLNTDLGADVTKRVKALGKDAVVGSVFGTASNIKSALIAVPSVGAISGGLAYLEGASNEDVAIATIVGSVMEGSFRMARPTSPQEVLRRAAEQNLREAGADIPRDATPEQLKAAYEKIVGDQKTALERARVDRALQILELSKPVKPKDAEVPLKDAIKRVSEIAKGERKEGRTYTGDPAAARELKKLKPEDIATPDDLYQKAVELKVRPEILSKIKEYISGEHVNDMIAMGKETLPLSAFDKLKFSENKKKLDEAFGEISMEMQMSEAGERIMYGEGNDRGFLAKESTFPQWIPEHLRLKTIFNKVNEYLIDGKIPEKGRAKELYDVIAKEASARSGIDALSVNEAAYFFKKLETIEAFKSTADEMRKYVMDKVAMKRETYSAEELSKNVENSFLNKPGEALKKPNRLHGEGFSFKEAKTGLAQSGVDIPNRIIFGKNDAGKIILKDGSHLLEAYRQMGIDVPARKVKFEDNLNVDILAGKNMETAGDWGEFVNSENFKRAMADPELSGLIKDIRETNKVIEQELKDITYDVSKPGSNGANKAEENRGREGNVEESNVEVPQRRAEKKRSDTRVPEGEIGKSENPSERISIETHKDVANAFGELLKSTDHERVRNTAVRLYKDVADALAKGEISSGEVSKILEKDSRLSVADFAETYKEQISQAGKELNVLSQLQKQLKANLISDLKVKIDDAQKVAEHFKATKDQVELAKRNEALFVLEKLQKELDSIEKNMPDVPETSWNKLRDGFTAIDNVRRGLLVTQVATTMRNIISQTMRSTVMLFDDIQVALMQTATGKQTARSAFRAVLNDAIGFAHRFTKEGRSSVKDYLSANPIAEAKLYNKATGEQGPTGKVVDTLNTLNRAQEYFFRNAVFEAKLRTKLEKRNIHELTNKEWNDVVNDALEITFAKTPDAGTFGSSIMKLYREVPMLSLINPFPRFWVNSVKFLFDYSPGGFLKFMSAKKRAALANGEYSAYRDAARAITGSLMLSAAVAIRESDVGGDKWYEIKVKGKTIDLRAFAPFSSYLFLADLIRYSAGRKVHLDGMDYAQGILSINRIAGTGLSLIDLFRAQDFKGFGNTVSNIVGPWLGGFTVPFRNIGDAVAGVIDEEALVRYQKSSHALNNVINPTLNNLPFLKRLLPKYPDITSERFLENEHPWVKQLTGLNLMTKTWLAGEIDRLAIPYTAIYPNTGEKKLDLYIMEEMGKIFEVQGKALEKDPDYISASEFMKKNKMADLISEVKQVAKMRAMTKHSEDFMKVDRDKALKKFEESKE